MNIPAELYMENPEDALNLNEVADHVRSVACQMAELAKDMAALAEQQRANNAAFERLRLAARECAESAARAAEHSAKARLICEGRSGEKAPDVSAEPDTYDVERRTEAQAAINRAKDTVAEMKCRQWDKKAMAAMLRRVIKEHGFVRNWAAEVVLDNSELAGKVRMLVATMDSTEAYARNLVKSAVEMPPSVRTRMEAADKRVQQIIDDAAKDL